MTNEIALSVSNLQTLNLRKPKLPHRYLRRQSLESPAGTESAGCFHILSDGCFSPGPILASTLLMSIIFMLMEFVLWLKRSESVSEYLSPALLILIINHFKINYIQTNERGFLSGRFFFFLLDKGHVRTNRKWLNYVKSLQNPGIIIVALSSGRFGIYILWKQPNLCILKKRMSIVITFSSF